MSRARDLANLGDINASDLTTGTLGNTVQDNITRLGTVTTGTLGANVTITDGANPHGWEHIKTIAYSADTASSTSAVNMTNVVSDKYSAYKIIGQWGCASDGQDLYFRFIDGSGNVNSAGNYYYTYEVRGHNDQTTTYTGSTTAAFVGNDIITGALGWNGEITLWNCYAGQNDFPQIDGHQLTYNARQYQYHPQGFYSLTNYDSGSYYGSAIGSINYNVDLYVSGFVLYYTTYASVQKDSWWSCYGLKLPTAD